MKRAVIYFLCLFGFFLLCLVSIVLLRHYNFYTTSIYDINKKRLLLISLDGMRHDHLEIAQRENIVLKNLNRLVKQGSRIMKVKASTPTVTMPNHQSIITGLYTPYHGIIYNTFNDSALKAQFSMEKQVTLNDPKFYKDYPEPVWVTCEKSKVCRSGSMLWPNTDADIEGVLPHRFVGQYFLLNEEYTRYPYDRRVKESVEWLVKDFVDFNMIYFEEPDATAHKYGPTHSQTLQQLKLLDNHLGDLLNSLENNNLLDKTDIIVTADHGMTDVSSTRIVDIDKYVDPNWYNYVIIFPMGFIYPEPGKEEEVYSAFKKAPHMRTYKRGDKALKEVHFSGNKNRISPIVVIVDIGWMVASNKTKRILKYKGYHGYDRDHDDMKAIFVAMGPSFKKDFTMPSIENVDIYPLLTHLLGLPTNAHNGSFARIQPILTEQAGIFTRKQDRTKIKWSMVMIELLLVAQLTYFTVFLLYHCFTNNVRLLRNRAVDELN